MKFIFILFLIGCSFEQKERIFGSKEEIDYFINTEYGILITTKKTINSPIK
jgi:hypothetical protein